MSFVSEFYDNCDILVTGGSGVVGKAIIEKLLRSYNVRKIYILLRPKKGLGIAERLEKLREAKIFRVLRSTKPDELNKLVAIPGDAVLPKLGITPEYKKMLDNVSIFFHCAATVRFDEPLKVALKLNVGGTLEALTLAETLKNLKVFMHVSTFFSNPYLKHVEEKVYESPMDWKLCMKLLENAHNEDILDFLTKKMIVGFPNTYTFTKNLAESLVHDFRTRVPVAIYRPSIVLFSLSEPEPQFPTSLMGATGLFALVGAGILKTVYLGKSVRFDITPQDVGVKTMLYYAYKTATKHTKCSTENISVYQTSSSHHNLWTFQQMGELMENENLWYKEAFEKNFLLPGCIYTESRFYYMCLVFMKEVIPGMLGDALIKMFGHKPAIMGIVRKAYISLEVMQPFMFNNYTSAGLTDEAEILEFTKGTELCIENDVNTAETYEKLVRVEHSMLKQIREVLLHEDPATVPKAQRILKIKSVAYNIVRGILMYYLCRWLYRYIHGHMNS